VLSIFKMKIQKIDIRLFENRSKIFLLKLIIIWNTFKMFQQCNIKIWHLKFLTIWFKDYSNKFKDLLNLLFTMQFFILYSTNDIFTLQIKRYKTRGSQSAFLTLKCESLNGVTNVLSLLKTIYLNTLQLLDTFLADLCFYANLNITTLYVQTGITIL
jgi:hypothetical protein